MVAFAVSLGSLLAALVALENSAFRCRALAVDAKLSLEAAYALQTRHRDELHRFATSLEQLGLGDGDVSVHHRYGVVLRSAGADRFELWAIGLPGSRVAGDIVTLNERREWGHPVDACR